MQPEIHLGPRHPPDLRDRLRARVHRRRRAGGRRLRSSASRPTGPTRWSWRRSSAGSSARGSTSSSRTTTRSRTTCSATSSPAPGWSGTAARSAARSASASGPGGAGCSTLALLDLCAAPLALGYAHRADRLPGLRRRRLRQGLERPLGDGLPARHHADRHHRSTRRPIYETLAMGLVAYLLWRLRDRFRAGRPVLHLPDARRRRAVAGRVHPPQRPTSSLGLTQAQLISVGMIAAGARLARRAGAAAAASRAPLTPPSDRPQAERSSPPSSGITAPVRYAGALRAQERDQVAVLLRVPQPAGGDLLWALRSISSHDPQFEASRSVAKRPVATVLTVTPSPATSRGERLQEARPSPSGGRSRGRGSGSARRIELEPTLTIRPQAALAHRRQRRLHQRRGAPAPASGRRSFPLLERVVEGAAQRWARRCWRPGSRPAAERSRHLAGKRGEPLQVGGVRLERDRLAPDLRRRRLDALPRAAGHRHPRALARQRLGDAAADAPAGAHDERHAARRSRGPLAGS